MSHPLRPRFEEALERLAIIRDPRVFHRRTLLLAVRRVTDNRRQSRAGSRRERDRRNRMRRDQRASQRCFARA